MAFASFEPVLPWSVFVSVKYRLVAGGACMGLSR